MCPAVVLLPPTATKKQELKHLQRLALDENQLTELPAVLGLLADTLTDLTVYPTQTLLFVISKP